MPDYGDVYGLPPVPLDPVPDLASLTWPWDQPAPVAPGGAVIPGAVDVAAAPPIPDAATPAGELVPAGAPLAAPGEPPPAAAGAPLAAPTEPLPAMQPGLGIPQAALDALVPPAPAAPPPAGQPPPFEAAPPVVATPAAEQPLTAAAGVAAPVPGESIGAPPADLAGLAPAPLAEPGLPPAPSPLTPSPVLLPEPIEPVTGMVEPAGMPGEPYVAARAGAPETPEQRYARVAGEYQRDPNKLLDRLEQPGALDTDTQRYLDDFAARDPAGAAVLHQRMVDAATARAAADRMKLEQDNFDRQKANMDRLKAARAEAAKKAAEIEAESTRMAETKIGYHPSTFQRIAGIIAAVVGGLYQGRTGSARNPGLDALNDVINRDLEEQKLNLANRRDVLNQRRSALGELTARTNDEYQADEIMRLAALKHAEQQIAQEQLNFAPDGTRGLNLAMLRAGLNSQIATATETRNQKLFENSLKVQDAARQQQTADEAARHNRASEGLEWAKYQASKGPTFTPDQWALIHPDNPRPPLEMNEKDYQSFLQARKVGGEIANQSPENLRSIPGVTIVDPKSGEQKPFIATGRPEFVEAAKKKKVAITKITSLIDDAIRTRSGWTTNIGNSAERQQLNTIWNTAQLEVKEAYGLGQISETDAKYMNGVLGTNDPSKLRDPIDGMRKARQIFENSLNTELHGVGLPDSEHYRIPDLSSPAKPKETVADKERLMVLGKPEDVARQNFAPDGSIRPARTSEWELFPEQQRAYRGQPLQPDYHAHGVLLQKEMLDQWAQRAQDPADPRRDEAWRSIVDMGGPQGAATAEVRDYARALLTHLQARAIDRIPSVIPEGR